MHAYQSFCVDFIKSHPVAVLLLDMGLGKTVITLTALNDLILDEFSVSRVLVIAPLRVARETWPTEARKWPHLKHLSVTTVTGSLKEREAALKEKSLIYVINRENLAWLVENYEWNFDCVVIDELSSFKNHRAVRFKALKKVRRFVKRWIALTGTPASNGLMDLWSEIGILDGGERLGRFIGRYREAFFRPDFCRNGIVYSYKLLPGAEEQIYKRIADITISMKAVDHLDMPERIYVNHEVEMNKAEREIYDTLKNEMYVSLNGQDIDGVNASTLLQKLMQLSNGAVYDENHEVCAIHDRKLDALEDLIEAANGQPVLVAYWFKHDRERIMKRFPEARDLDVKSWNAGKMSIALMHPASAGHGLNIQEGGHILIWFGLTWSLELYQQTNARLWRQGQTQAVTIHHIITRDTVDSRVLSALAKKETNQNKLIEAVKAEFQS